MKTKLGLISTALYSCYFVQNHSKVSKPRLFAWPLSLMNIVCISEKMSCPELQQKPKNGKLNCRYTERTNGNICFVQCMKGHFFVSGENNYVTCGAESEFEWSHRRVNKTARIPACTSEFI